MNYDRCDSFHSIMCKILGGSPECGGSGQEGCLEEVALDCALNGKIGPTDSVTRYLREFEEKKE